MTTESVTFANDATFADEESPRCVGDTLAVDHSEAETETPTKDKKVMSRLSECYDRDHKGFLDATERAMKNMDTSSRGFVSNDKVYELMKQSVELQHQMFNMKRIIIGLVVFSVILALSNLGTAFAAASLAKDTSVSSEGEGSTPTLRDKATNQEIATLNKGAVVHAVTTKMPIADDERRDLRELLLNETDTNATDSANETDANVTEIDLVMNSISFAEAEQIWTNCEQSTPTTISHDCSGSETISTVGCAGATRNVGASYQYEYADGLRINCGCSSLPCSGCTVVGLQCSDGNRAGGEQCTADELGSKPSMTEINVSPIPAESICTMDCQCESGCCVFWTTNICMDGPPNSAMSCIGSTSSSIAV